jgi:hypothetical protein
VKIDGTGRAGRAKALTRFRAWLLLALFLGAGTSLPSPDALLFHSHVDPFAGRVHVEPAGGCTAHGEHCTLGRTSPGSRALAPLAFRARPVSTALSTLLQQPPVPVIVARVSLLPKSRAPPAPSA